MPRLRLDLSAFIRLLIPGTLVYCYLSNFASVGSVSTPTLMLTSLAVGVLLFAFHRATVWVLIRSSLARLGRMPQYDFHLRLLNEVEPNVPHTITEDHRGVLRASGFVSTFISENAKGKFATDLSFMNSFVHALYMAAIVALVGSVHQFFIGEYLIGFFAILIALASLFTGAMLDYQMDVREFMFLKSHQDKYRAQLRKSVGATNSRSGSSSGGTKAAASKKKASSTGAASTGKA